MSHAYVRPENAGQDRPKSAMLLGNPMIHVTGDTAVMDAIYTGVVNPNPDKAPEMREQGHDHVEFMKVNGQWKIKKRVLDGYSFVAGE